jgi:hypothetical protein
MFREDPSVPAEIVSLVEFTAARYRPDEEKQGGPVRAPAHVTLAPSIP